MKSKNAKLRAGLRWGCGQGAGEILAKVYKLPAIILANSENPMYSRMTVANNTVLYH